MELGLRAGGNAIGHDDAHERKDARGLPQVGPDVLNALLRRTAPLFGRHVKPRARSPASSLLRQGLVEGVDSALSIA